MIYCHHCGTKAEENLEFCEKCHKKLGGTSIEKINQNSVENKNKYDLENVNFEGPAHLGDKIHQEIHDNSVKYEVNMEDIHNIETLSIYLTTHFKEKNLNLFGGGSLIGGFISLFLTLNSYGTKIISWLPQFNSGFLYFLIPLAIILFFIGGTVINAVVYKQKTKCKKCEKDYAYLPSRNPTVRETDARGGTRKTTTYYYKCRYCGDEKNSPKSEFIPYENEEDEEELDNFL